MSVWTPIALTLTVGVLLISWAVLRMKKLSRQVRAHIGGGSPTGLEGYVGEVLLVKEGGYRGKARFRGEIWDIESTEPLQKGDFVQVQTVVGLKAQVQKLSQKGDKV
ncbi:hypothetical protein D6817_01235 [Candidatus Pacearchaeota archaeon]|nr:MAG: hypothetical protein D6817_01235 [Candidatus Pacearchaeota archaeon]